MADRHDDMAKVAGEAAGLSPEKWPGLAHILRVTASDEREACANIARDAAIEQRQEWRRTGGQHQADAVADEIAALITKRGG